MAGCPFCDISDDDIIWRSGLAVAMYDRFSVSKGHVLVIPKRHAETYFDASSTEEAELWRVVGERTLSVEDVLSFFA